MSFTDSPSHRPFFANNVPMDVNSDAEAEQAALELAQAQERLRAAKEAREKRQEERKRQEEERKASTMAAIKLAAEQAAEMAVDRERRIQFRVSFGFFVISFYWRLTVLQQDLEVSVMTPEPLLAPFTDKGKEVSTGLVPGFDTGTNTETGGPFGDQRGSVL